MQLLLSTTVSILLAAVRVNIMISFFTIGRYINRGKNVNNNRMNLPDPKENFMILISEIAKM